MISAETQYSKEHFKYAPRQRKARRKAMIFCIVYIPFLILLIYTVLRYGNAVGLLFSVVVFICLLLLLRLCYKLAPGNLYKRHVKAFPGRKTRVTFEDETVKIDSAGLDTSSNLTLRYSNVTYAGYENDFFIFVFNNALFTAFNSSEFKEGTPEELKQFLRNKFGAAFIEK